MQFRTLKFDETIKKWDEAVPLGNGAMGCLIWGESDALRLSIDRCDMWDCSGAQKAGGEFTYESLIRLHNEKKQDDIYRVPGGDYKACCLRYGEAYH